MTDHRRVQRTLFRMQHDPSFARALRDGDPDAVASTGLGDDDLALLRPLSAAAVAADAGGKRLAQFLRNVSSEHALTLARATARDAALLDSFPASSEFHRAIREDLPLPLAFAAHARSRADALGDRVLSALALLEDAMARARRAGIERPAAEPGGIVLAPRADVLLVPRGSLAAAAAIRQALDAGSPLPDVEVDAAEVEHVLVLGGSRDSPHRLADASVELLSPLAGELLVLARVPAGPADLQALAARHDVPPEELESFVGSLAADDVIRRT